jgi:hypothetical protein
MTDVLFMMGFLVLWIVLQVFILPLLGIST